MNEKKSQFKMLKCFEISRRFNPPSLQPCRNDKHHYIFFNWIKNI